MVLSIFLYIGVEKKLMNWRRLHEVCNLHKDLFDTE